MNSGVIASRYAKALLKYADEAGAGDKVYSQAVVIVLRMEEVRQLREYLEDHPEIIPEKKLQLLEAALGEEPAPELKNFLNLVIQRRRCGYFMRMMYSFISQYRSEASIKVGKIVTAMPAEGLKEKLEEAFGNKTGAKVILEEKVDPAIIGGFVFELDDWRMDASVRSHLEKIRNCLVETNNRIV